ncbi:TetR-like C-terminal domain-containing protein [Kibdelosporangium persicum]|uniref:Transcriptional repressor C-terminal n=1 Tax=Kibdelosporangium persicum TaxID=2698649 RepID=A0ABX2F9I7_9PSEU|nr:TetR-like C-terminal domain-containing protein [Kibdelosporangium persicum]NRN68036.1 Transcriptional repressor C-terminal [Kibdelosporangium persicum]
MDPEGAATRTSVQARTGGSGTRRRGEALTGAIGLATLEELARTSFEELSFDKIAAAAGTGKAALYRRWSTPAELVLAALTDPATGFGDVPAAPRTGTLRADLIALLTRLARALEEPRGRALRPLIAHRHRHPELFEHVHRLVIRPHLEVLLTVLREAAERGEAAPERVTERVASVGPRMITLEAWECDQMDPREVEAVVDEVLLPLVQP